MKIKDHKTHPMEGRRFIKWVKKASHWCLTEFIGGKQKQTWSQTKPE